MKKNVTSLTRIRGVGGAVEMARNKCVKRSECEQDPELPITMNQVLKREILHYERERDTPTRGEWRRKQQWTENATCKVVCQHTHFNNWKTETLKRIQVMSRSLCSEWWEQRCSNFQPFELLLLIPARPSVPGKKIMGTQVPSKCSFTFCNILLFLLWKASLVWGKFDYSRKKCWMPNMQMKLKATEGWRSPTRMLYWLLQIYSNSNYFFKEIHKLSYNSLCSSL